MACDRCGSIVSRDGFNVGATFDTLNGEGVYIAIKMIASRDAIGFRSVQFCVPCWMLFYELLGEQFRRERLSGDQATTPGSPVRPGS